MKYFSINKTEEEILESILSELNVSVLEYVQLKECLIKLKSYKEEEIDSLKHKLETSEDDHEHLLSKIEEFKESTHSKESFEALKKSLGEAIIAVDLIKDAKFELCG